jgi:two-component system phosphate regulon response regulator PhoB
VLVVEDDADTREMLTLMLETVGLSVNAIGSAERARHVLSRDGYDLVILDWRLPGISGLELCKEIRADANFACMPVIFLTANGSSQDMVQAFACGADDYLLKPFRAAELGARIFALLRRSRRPFLTDPG